MCFFGNEQKREKEDSIKQLEVIVTLLRFQQANFARWEPAHGSFNFRHPWKQYLKIGAAMRNCGFCIESLSSSINSEVQVNPLV